MAFLWLINGGDPNYLRPSWDGVTPRYPCPTWQFCCTWSPVWDRTGPTTIGDKKKVTYIWSNYSDLTRPHPKWWFSKGNSLISGKSRLVKYYNLARVPGSRHASHLIKMVGFLLDGFFFPLPTNNGETRKPTGLKNGGQGLPG